MRIRGGPLFILGLCMAASVSEGSAQEPERVTVVPDSSFLAGSVWRFLWGRDYRRSWATPITVPFLDLDAVAGGLQPLRRGGGLQTRSLRLAGADGREYAFRSVNKDPTAVLPSDLRASLAADLVKDQISSQHPYGALVVDSILSAVGVLHASPRLYVMPDVAKLGEFRQDFALTLGFLEERPDENDGAAAAFFGAERVIGSERLFERIAASSADRVDAVAYLQARLVDFLLGDWDRHRDQWRWARFQHGPWQPVPRDRDQAFARLDGFVPSKARFVVPQLVGFSEEFVSVFSLSWSGREMDRHFLASVERPVYDSLAHVIQSRVTDDVIDGAVSRLPSRVLALDGHALRRRLKARRDALAEAADAFYLQLAGEVDLHGTDESEVLTLTDDGEGRLRLTLATEARPDDILVARSFSPLETRELRVRLHDGEDRVHIGAQVRTPFPVRIVLGPGDDTVRFDTDTRGVILYDEEGQLEISGGSDPDVRRRPYEEWVWSEEDPAPRRDWGHAVFFEGDFGVSSDYGLLLGVGASRERYGFRRDPYGTFVKGLIAASTSGKIEARLEADVRLEARSSHVFVTAGGTQFDVVHFYGFGNDTQAPEPETFYDVQRARVGLEAGFGTQLTPGLDWLIATQAVFNRTSDVQDRFIATIPDLYGAGDTWQLGVRSGGRWRTTGAAEGTRGSLLDVDITVYPAVGDIRTTFGALDGFWRGYVPLSERRLAVLAFRAGGRTIWGEAPWFESAFLGGDNLRGLPAQRYAGDASVYGSGEIRVQVGTANVLVPELIGVLALADVGRVWVDGASPGGWHTGFGGGLWLGLINDKTIVSAAYAVSEGGGRLHLDLGFAF